jgi:hypothetical protein
LEAEKKRRKVRKQKKAQKREGFFDRFGSVMDFTFGQSAKRANSLFQMRQLQNFQNSDNPNILHFIQPTTAVFWLLRVFKQPQFLNVSFVLPNQHSTLQYPRKQNITK